jgi:hypothetical protein
MSNKKSKYEKLDSIKMEEIMNQYSVYKANNPNNTDIQFVEDFNVVRIEQMDYNRFAYIKRTWCQKSDDEAKGILTVDISIKDCVISLFTSNIINPNSEAKAIYDAFVNAYPVSLYFDESKNLINNIRNIKSSYLKNRDNADIIDYNSLNSTSNSNNINATIDINNNTTTTTNNNNTNNTNNNDSNKNNDMDMDHNIDDDDETSVSNFGMYK